MFPASYTIIQVLIIVMTADNYSCKHLTDGWERKKKMASFSHSLTPARADCARLSQCAFWFFITSLDQHEDAFNRHRVSLLDDLFPKFRLQLPNVTFWESMIWKKKTKRQESDGAA